MNLPCGHAVAHGGLQPLKSRTENKCKRHKGRQKVLITIPTQTWLTPGRTSPLPPGCPRLRGARDASGAARHRGAAPSGPVGRRPRSAATMQRRARPRPAAHAGDAPRGPLPVVPGSLGSRLAPLFPRGLVRAARRGASPRSSGGEAAPLLAEHALHTHLRCFTQHAGDE